MSYPNAYCVKCGSHTDTQQKHTVLLQNSARALKGVCSACSSDVYKILPKNKSFLTKVPLTAEEHRRFPDAFCVKCQEHTPTVNPHTVLFENMSRAVTGSCGKCGSEVYRILGGKDEGAVAPVMALDAAKLPAKTALARPMPKSPLGESLRKPRMTAAMAAGERRVALSRAAEASSAPGRWTYLAAAGVIFSIIAAFLVYSLH